MDSEASPLLIERTLRALRGCATLGDLIVATALPMRDVEQALEKLMAEERVQVAVSESAVLTYRLHTPHDAGRRERCGAGPRRRACRTPVRAGRRASFERRTLRLIRARAGVLSLAELVEHTGLPLPEAEREMQRLAEAYGGEVHSSWDGHRVYAFPELMASAHSGAPVREPRPAWVRSEDPMRISRHGADRRMVGRIVAVGGLLASAALPAMVVLQAQPASGTVAVAGAFTLSVAGLLLVGRSLGRMLRRTRIFRFRDPESLRRYALGFVFETALKGKGVVSLDRTVRWLQGRAGRSNVSRSAVRAALTGLAREFDAPVTEVNGDLFFGFRNVKRQFLASHVVRTRMHLGRTAAGATVFHSGDTALDAAARELAAFDRELEQALPRRAG